MGLVLGEEAAWGDRPADFVDGGHGVLLEEQGGGVLVG